MEKTLYFQRGETNIDQKHTILLAKLLYVFVLDAEDSEFNVRTNLKGFFLGRQDLSEVSYCLFK